MHLRNLIVITISAIFSFTLFAQGDDSTDDMISVISGAVTDASSGKPIAGANVIVDEGDLGAAADGDGKYTIEGVSAGASVTASAIGYEDLTLFADQEELNFELSPMAVEMSELEVLASRASEKTALHIRMSLKMKLLFV